MMFERCAVQCSAVIVGGGKGEGGKKLKARDADGN